MSDELIEIESPVPPYVVETLTPSEDLNEVIVEGLVMELVPPPDVQIDVFPPDFVEEVEISEPVVIYIGSVNSVTGEVPAGGVNGTNQDYTTVNPYQSASLEVFINGLRMRVSADYSVTGSNSFHMAIPLLTGDSIVVNYMLQ